MATKSTKTGLSLNSDSPASSIIQFATNDFFCRDSDGVIEVSVIRIGKDMSLIEQVEYEVQSDSAIAGVHFAGSRGSVLFGPGEYDQKIRVHVMASPVWQPVLQFTIRLDQPDSKAAWELGQFSSCSVSIVHSGPFPTAAVVMEPIDDGIDAGRSWTIPLVDQVNSGVEPGDGTKVTKHSSLLRRRLMLYYEFGRKVYAIEHVRAMTPRQLAIDAFDSILYLWQLVLSVYFVDHVVDPVGASDVEARFTLSFVIGLSHAVPTILNKHLKEQAAWLGIGGAARKELQVEVLRKYLQMTPRSRERVGASGFIAALTRDTMEVVDNGFMQLYALAAAFSKVVVILMYTAVYAPTALPVQLCLPLFMLLRMYWSEAVATVLRLKYFKALNTKLELASEVSSKYALVRDARLKIVMARTLIEEITTINYLKNAVAAHTTRSLQALPVISACMVGGMMAAAPYVMDNLHMTAGTFLATLAATTQMGVQVQVFFDALGQMQLSIASLLEVFAFLNMPTESTELMLASLKQQERGRKVAQDSTLQAASRKADAKWLKKLGLDERSTVAAQDTASAAQVEPRTEVGGRYPRDGDGGAGEAHVEAEATVDDILVELLDVKVSVVHRLEDAPDELRMHDLAGQFHGTFDESADDSAAQAAPVECTSSSTPVPSIEVFSGCNLQLAQGRVYAVVGHGKSSMLRLLAKVRSMLALARPPSEGQPTYCPLVSMAAPRMLAAFPARSGAMRAHALRRLWQVSHPTSGEVFVPPHLSIEHVEEAPMFFKELTLYENLVIRLRREDWPPVEHVVEVCSLLGLSRRWIDYLQASGVHDGSSGIGHASRSPMRALPKDPVLAASMTLPGEGHGHRGWVGLDVQSWESELTASEKQTLQLAAALLTDPNLLVLHRPTASHEHVQADVLLHCFKEVVAKRGVGGILSGKPGALARTVIFSCAVSDEQALGIADGVIVMGRPARGATLFEADMLLQNAGGAADGAADGSRGTRLSRQVAGLMPRPAGPTRLSRIQDSTGKLIREMRLSKRQQGSLSVDALGQQEADADACSRTSMPCFNFSRPSAPHSSGRQRISAPSPSGGHGWFASTGIGQRMSPKSTPRSALRHGSSMV